MKIPKIEINKWEQLDYPNLDTKRMVIDSTIAYAVNDLIEEVQKLKERIK